MPESTEAREHRRQYQREYYLRNRERQKANRKPAADRRGEHLKYRYGITQDQYDEMLAQQLGGCAICARPPGKVRLHVDHDHSSGRVRALLCGPCNGALHYLENQTWLESATAYLKKYCQPC